MIGLIGPKESGKTTVFNMIKYSQPRTRELMLAGKLKEVCSKVTGLPLIYFNHQDLKEKKLENPISINEDVLKYIAMKYSIKDHHLPSLLEKLGGIGGIETPRKMLQIVGTDLLRTVNEDIHIEAAVASMVDNHPYVVTDIRFLNELTYFKSNVENFTAIYVYRKESEDKAMKSKHPSERGVVELKDYADIILNNNSTLENLNASVMEILHA